MLTLHDFQTMFRNTMFGTEATPLLTAIAADGLSPSARLQIYRHHILTSLTEALEATFPVVCRLVERRFFAYAADTYIRQHPPEAACVSAYGAGFPDFLEAFPPCHGLPYLADVARLEWALNVAYHAEECQPVGVDALRDIPGEQIEVLTFRCAPACILLRSVWPIDEIWRANQGGDEVTTPAIDLDSGGVCLEVLRWEAEVGFRTLEPAVYTFRAMLAAGQQLGTAVEAAVAVDEAFDCTAALGELFKNGTVIGWAL